MVLPRQEEQIQAPWADKAAARVQHGAQQSGCLPGAPPPPASPPPPRAGEPQDRASHVAGQLVSPGRGCRAPARRSAWHDTGADKSRPLDRIRHCPSGTPAELSAFPSAGQRSSRAAEDRQRWLQRRRDAAILGGGEKSYTLRPQHAAENQKATGRQGEHYETTRRYS